MATRDLAAHVNNAVAIAATMPPAISIQMAIRCRIGILACTLAPKLTPGEWDVAKVGLPGRGPIVNVQEAKPRPPHPDDPRPAHWRNVGGPYGT